MVNILYLSVALIAIAFLVLVIYISKTLKSLQETLTSVSKTLVGLEKQLDGVTSETTILLQKTNALADDIGHKSESLTSVVEAVKDVGTTVTKFNGTLRNITNSFDHQVEQNREKISQIIQWSDVVLELKDKWKERKQRKNESANEVKRVRSR
ncbi:MAG TPA: DUF948 domain-containing protein [Neobacillus sp.]|jgi:uncharacterized protein YoxC